MRGGTSKAARQAAWGYLALAALCLRALVPDGFMLARGEQTWASVVPCPARSPELVELLSRLGHAHHDHGHHHDHDAKSDVSAAAQCPFAVAIFGATPSTQAFSAPVYSTQAPVLALAAGIARLPAARNPPATGPPAVLV